MSELTCTAEPLSLKVALGEMEEPDLMRALEQVITHWHCSHRPEDSDAEIRRSVNWLHAKYGATP